MDRTQSLGLSLLLATVVSGAWAEDSLTRTDVIAETHAAQLAGNIPHGDLDITAAKGPDVHPPWDRTASPPVPRSRPSSRKRSSRAT
jgi:hypothetical protein